MVIYDVGAWLSLVERFVRDEEVARSNRVAPTIPPYFTLEVLRREPLFSKFSPASGRVLRAAEQECRNHNHYYVGVEHLAVALLDEQDDGVSQWLQEHNIDAGEAHSQLRRALGTGEDRMWEGILITPRVRKVVAIAAERAGDRNVEPHDLLEAILAEGASAAANILESAKCTA